MCTYTYIYIERERCVYVHIYMYMCIYNINIIIIINIRPARPVAGVPRPRAASAAPRGTLAVDKKILDSLIDTTI